MLDKMCTKVLVKKRFYHPLRDGLTVELDVFDQLDLYLAEVELPSEQTTFAKPDWFTEDVSNDPKYFNNNIIKRLE